MPARTGADALGQAAAALAAISLVFKGIEANYSAALLTNATELYRCASPCRERVPRAQVLPKAAAGGEVMRSPCWLSGTWSE